MCSMTVVFPDNLRTVRLSLSGSPRDFLKYFEISVPRHIRFAELMENIEQLHFTNEYVIRLLKLEMY